MYSSIRLACAAALVGGCLFAGSPANALNFSFTGNFQQDDDVQLFQFVAGAGSTVTLRSYSYAGGVNAAGATILGGGFDPILALYDSAGVLLGYQDDGPLAVPADAQTGRQWDTHVDVVIPSAGTYTVAIMQFDNFPVGLVIGVSNLSQGFQRDGQGNFTAGNTGCTQSAFCDVSGVVPGVNRDSHWAFDILNVEQAVVVDNTPVPAALPLFASGLGALAFLARRKKRKAQAA